MRNDTYARIINEAKFIILNCSTVRETAKAFGVSKSTVHKDLSEKLFFTTGLYINKLGIYWI